MAITVKSCVNMLRRMPEACPVQARVPSGDGSAQVKPLQRVGHHGRDESDVHPEQPVEMFTDQGEAPAMTVGDLLAELRRFPGDSLVRVAVPMPPTEPGDPGHHRCLDIETAGFAPGDEDFPPVEMHTERWDGSNAIIRVDDHAAGTDLGDLSYAQETIERDPATGEYVLRGPVRATVVGRAPERGNGKVRQ